MFSRILIGIFLSFQMVDAEEIVTSKKNEPDAFYGLKLGVVATPTYGYRVRDGSSGKTDDSPSDVTGFSSPWTLLTISKSWNELGIKAEFWGEIVRTSNLTDAPPGDNGLKINPYIFSVRRANIQKTFTFKMVELGANIGIQDQPQIYMQWQNYWNWRYIDQSPMERLKFSEEPADLGISIFSKISFFSAQIALLNGDGYRNIQNTNSTGYDINGRISLEPKIHDLVIGLHLLGRKANALGLSGSECKEGKSSCLPNDGNTATMLEKDIRSRQSVHYGAEFNIVYKPYFNFGIGAMFKKNYGGQTIDHMNPFASPTYEKDSIGRGSYFWVSSGTGMINLVFRGETGTGNNGNTSIDTVVTKENFIENSLSSNGSLNNPTYSSKASFVRTSFYIEYVYTNFLKFAIGFSEARFLENDGTPKKTYIDFLGDERNRTDYTNSILGNNNLGVKEYSYKDRRIFLKSMIHF